MLNRLALSPIILLTLVGMSPLNFSQETAKIKFSKKMPPKGTVCMSAHRESTKMTFSSTIPGQPSESYTEDENKHYITVYTIKEVTPQGVTKVSVEFKKREATKKSTKPGQEKSKADPLAGKTFTVSVGESGLEATNKKGKQPTLEEMTALQKKYKKLAGLGVVFDPFDKLETELLNKEFSIGDVIHLDSSRANKIFSTDKGDGGIKLSGAKLTLKRKKTILGIECAVFALQLEFGEDALPQVASLPEATISIDIKGEMVVGISNCWLYERSTAGPLLIRGGGDTPQGKFEISVSGEGKENTMKVYTSPRN